MADSEDIQAWAKRQKLTAEVTAVLEENGFTTVELLAALTPADIKESFQDTGVLNLAQCLALRRALATLTHPHGAPPPPFPPPQGGAATTTTTGPSPSHPWGAPPPPAASSPPPPAGPAQPYPPQPHPHSSYPYPHAPSYPAQIPAPVSQAQQTPGYPQAQGPYPQHFPAPYGPHPAYPPHPAAGGGGLYPSLSPGQGAAARPPPHVTPGQLSWSSGEGAEAVGGAGLMAEAAGSKECFRFLLLGKTGSGKSTTGNTIFGERLFNTATTFSSVTSECERKTNTRGGRKIEIIDSPGLYDTHKSQEEIGVLIVQAVAGMHPGPHAILYVVRLGRYTAEDHGAYERLKALFNDAISRYLVVVFTHGDMLEREGGSIQDMIASQSPQTLLQVLSECNHRYVVFNNMAPDPRPQVEQLLQMVRRVVVENGGQPYSCPKYSSIGQGMEEEVARRLQEVERRDLQRQQYVQQLEQQTQEAEEAARRTKEQCQKNEEERARRLEAEEEKRRVLEGRLQAQIQEQQIGFEKYQQELLALHQEREEKEREMKEKEAQMSEMEKRRAEEQAEEMREQERKMQDLLAQHEERLRLQKLEDEERRQAMEREKEEFLQQMEQQRRQDREELERREADMEKLLEQQREEERRAAERREEEYEQEMEKLKSQVVAGQLTNVICSCASAIRGALEVAMEFYRVLTFDQDPSPGGHRLGGREAFRPDLEGMVGSGERD